MIIDRPIITEKSVAAADKGTYTFAVAPKATKNEVAKAIQSFYKVDVIDVRVMSVKGKEVRRRTGIGKENDWKKALVILKKGQKINDFEFEADKDEKHDHKHDHKEEVEKSDKKAAAK